MVLLSPHTKPKKLTSWQDSEHIPQSGVPPNVIPSFGYFKEKHSFLGKAFSWILRLKILWLQETCDSLSLFTLL